MKSLRIPLHKVRNAYLLIGEEREQLYEAALRFAEELLQREGGEEEPLWKRLSYPSKEEWRESVRKRIRAGEHPDLFRLLPDKPEEHPKMISVDNIRRNLVDSVEIRPYEAEYKIYIIIDADKMNAQAQNALLKTLEEPPEYAVILLLSGGREAFLPTVLSRLIEFSGGERDARERFLSFYEEEWAKEFSDFLPGIKERAPSEILRFLKEHPEEKLPIRELFSFLEIILRDVLCYKSPKRQELLYAREISGTLIRMASDFDYSELGKITDELARDVRELSLNVNRELQLEQLLFSMGRREEGQPGSPGRTIW